MRSKQFYVSTDVYRAYWLLANANKSTENPSLVCGMIIPDEIADHVLREFITLNYPQLFDHQKQVDTLEKQLIEQLTKPTP